MAKVNKTFRAAQDLNDIWDFIAESDETQADKFIDSLLEKCELLAKFPEMGRTRHKFIINLRSFPVKKLYRFYLPVENGIEILRVLHASRDIMEVFDEMIDETKKSIERTRKIPRISASSYSNTAPLIWSFLFGSQHGKYELILDNAPARSAELLEQKRVDCALVPVIEYQRIDDILLVEDVCVGAKERVRSVCLVTKGENLEDIETVALDVSSKTSVALTKIIFREFFDTEPNYLTAKPNLDKMLAEADCALLIGDPALTIDETKHRKFDLAETWKSFTNFGFVFAMWMAREDSVKTARKIDFADVRDEGLAHLDEIIANYETEIPLSRKEFKEYLSKNISFSIDENMRKGLSLYFELAAKHRLIEKNKPLKFLSL